MSEVWVYKIGVLLADLLGLGVIAAICVAAQWLVWWPATLFQLAFRPRALWWRLALVLLATAVLALLILPAGADVAVMFLLWLLAVPGFTSAWTNWAVWKQDGAERRKQVATLRNSMLERGGSARRVSETQVWSSYIIDSARLDRRVLYQPPGM